MSKSSKRRFVTKRRFVACALVFAMLMTLFGTNMGPMVKTVKAAETITIRGGNLYRNSDTTATAYIHSDTAGDIYYYPSTSKTAPTAAEIISSGTKSSTSAAAGAMSTVTIANNTGLYSVDGGQYVHVAVKNSDGDTSNVVTLAATEDRYLSEDFEAYEENATSGSSMFGLNANQTVVKDGGNQWFKISGESLAGSGGATKGRVVIAEGKIKSAADSPTAMFGFYGSSYYGNRWSAAVKISAGKWKSLTNSGENDLDQMPGTAVKNTTYTVRIVYDTFVQMFDVYIDGAKANSEPIAAANVGTSVGLNSSSGQVTYFDDIECYCPSKVTDTSKALVTFDPTTATYTTAQSVEMTTTLVGRDIVYTTDDSYPDLGSTKYTTPVTVGTNQTVRAMAVRADNGKAESLAFDETYTFVAAPKISGDNIYRYSDTATKLWLTSDVKGDIYYKYNDSDTPLGGDAIVANGTKASVAAEQDKSVEVTMDGTGTLTSGTGYVHVIVKDKDGVYSNEIVLYMPEDRYFADDFEAYKENADSGSSWFGLNANRTVVKDGGNQRLKIVGDQWTGYSLGTKGRIAIIEGKLKSTADSPTAMFGFYVYVGSSTGNRWTAAVKLDAGIWKSLTDGEEIELDRMTENAVKNTEYTVRIVYDIYLGKYDIYIDGKKANSEPVSTKRNGTYVGLNSSVGQTTYFGDIEYYCPSKITDTSKALITLTPTTATYTTVQNVEMATSLTDRDLVYTTDGSYPILSSMKYTSAIPVGTDKTTVRAMAVNHDSGKAESIAWSETYSFVSLPTIYGESIYRSGATAAKAWIHSDVAGEIYYKVNSSSTVMTGAQIEEGGALAAKTAVQDSTVEVVMSDVGGMSSGARYVHIVVKDVDGNYSNELQYYLPEDVYLKESFGTYEAGITTGDSLFGRDSSNRIPSLDGTNSIYKITGNTGINSFSLATRGRIYILEGKMKSKEDSPTAYLGFGYYSIGVRANEGTWQCYQDGVATDLDNISTKCVQDQSYTIRIVYDNVLRVYDVYIDGVKANKTPISGIRNNWNYIYMYSSTGQTTYFDDIEYYCPTNSTDALISFSPATATYSTSQNVKLTTAEYLSDRSIYYTKDVYPDISGSVYSEAGVDITNTKAETTLYAMLVKNGKAESVAYSETYAFVSAPKITSDSIYRESATKATAYLYSDVSGTVYYLVDDDVESPLAADLVSEGTEAATAVAQETTTAVTIQNGMKTGSKYVHLVLKDKDGGLSNVITHSMPEDVYIKEGFGSYFDGITNYNGVLGSRSSTNCVVESVSGNNAYKLINGASIYTPNAIQGRIRIVEGKIMSTADEPTAQFGFYGYTSSYTAWDYWMPSVLIENGVWKSYVRGDGTDVSEVLDNVSGKAVPNTWYTVRLVWDTTRNVFDIYIDGKRANSEPIAGYYGPGRSLCVYLGSSSGQTTYYDDIEYYCPTSDTSDFVNANPGEDTTFTVTQNVELTTTLSGRDIYYTTDGTIPTKDSTKYSGILSFTNTAPIRAIVGKNGKMESIATDKVTYTKVSAPTIRCSNVYRESAQKATVWLYSDVAGSVYYKVSDTKGTLTKSEIKSSGTKSAVSAGQQTTASVEVTADMESGERYAYFVVEDAAGTLSNVVSVEMPYDVYYTENFETYDVGTAANTSLMSLTGSANSKVTDGDSSKTFTVTDTSNNVRKLPTTMKGKLILEATVQSDIASATWNMYLAGNYDYRYNLAGIRVNSGIWQTTTGYNSATVTALNQMTTFTKDTKYRVRLEYDTDTNTYDIFINDVKAHTENLTGTIYSDLYLVLSSTSGQNTQFDDIKFYVEPYIIGIPTAKDGLVYNGTEQTGITYDTSSVAYTTPSNVKATSAGDYTAIFTLNDGYTWSDGTTAKKEIPWSIAKKELTSDVKVTTKTYDGTKDATIKAGELEGIIEGEEDSVQLVKSQLEGSFADEYVGTGKVVTTEEAFALSGSKKDNYKLTVPTTLTGTIQAAEQTLTKEEELSVLKGSAISTSELEAAVGGAKGELSFEVVTGNAYGTLTATGLSAKADAGGKTMTIRASAAAKDINNDGTPEYAANEDGVVLTVNILDKDVQTLTFSKKTVTKEYGASAFVEEASNDRKNGGAVTYSSDNESVATVDAKTGEVTVLTVGDTVITATAAETALYNAATASYKLTVNTATQEAPALTHTDETVKGKKDGTISGLTTEMEYKNVKDSEYKAVTGSELTGLAPATYLFRYQAKTGYEASGDTEVIIRQGKALKVRYFDGDVEYDDRSVSVSYDEKLTAPQDPEKDGYTFAGWSVKEGDTTKWNFESDTVTKDTILYAVWSKNPATPTPTPTVKPTVTPEPEKTTSPAPTVAPTPTPKTEYENVPVVQKDKVIKKTNTDKKDVEGSKVKFLQLKGTTKKKTITLTWKKISGANGYIIYGSRCGSKMKKITEITKTSTKKWKAKKLAKGAFYKYMVVAYQNTSEGQKVLTSSKTVHVVTDGGKRGNPTKLSIKKKSVSIRANRTFTISAEVKSKKKVPVHVADLRFESDNPDIAVVSDDGVIMGMKKGKTTIYVYTQNGICGKIKVKVKKAK